MILFAPWPLHSILRILIGKFGWKFDIMNWIKWKIEFWFGSIRFTHYFSLVWWTSVLVFLVRFHLKTKRPIAHLVLIPFLSQAISGTKHNYILFFGFDIIKIKKQKRDLCKREALFQKKKKEKLDSLKLIVNL